MNPKLLIVDDDEEIRTQMKWALAQDYEILLAQDRLSALELFKAPFPEAQATGAIVAMTSNFILNNFLTYRDQRLKGFALLSGLIMFYVVCSVGLLANVGVAFSVYDQEPIWWLAGAAGALMGVVWNYAMSGLFVWRKK